MAYRVEAGSRSFEVQKYVGLDKEGAEVWRTIAYFRSRASLARFVAKRKLPAGLADGLSEFHRDVAAAVHRFCLAEGAASNAAKAKSALMLARRQAA